MMEYGHGGDIYRNRNVELDFSVNVNPLGMPNFVWEAAQRSIAFCTGYPDSSCENLRGRLSEVTGVPEDQIDELAEHSAVCVPTMMPYITAFFMPRAKGDRPDVIPDGCVNFAFLGQFAETPRDTIFTTEYSVRTAMEAVYGLMGVDRGVPEVWGSVYDVRELLDASVKLMDGRSPLEIELPGPLNLVKKPLLKAIKGTLVEKVLRDHDVIKDYMLEK